MDESRKLMRQKLGEWFPKLSEATLQDGWTGLRTFASDRRPIMGKDPQSEGLWWACGLGGFGLTTSFAVGEALAHWVRGEETPWLEPEAMDPNRVYPSKWVIFPNGEHNDGVLVSR